MAKFKSKHTGAMTSIRSSGHLIYTLKCHDHEFEDSFWFSKYSTAALWAGRSADWCPTCARIRDEQFSAQN